MAFSFGFYNALEHDRKYDAVQVSMIFDGIINDGVYATVGKAFVVKEHPTTKNVVIVQPGRAWFDHTWNYNDSDMSIEIPQSDMTKKRIDALVFDINSDELSRTNEIKWIKGVPELDYPSKPTLLKQIGHKQYPLCYVTREPNNEKVYQYQIENMIGTNECPFVTGLLQVVSLDELLGKWRSELDRFVTKEEEDLNAWIVDMEEDFNTWSTNQKTSFSEWRATEEATFEEWKTEQQTSFASWMLNEKTSFGSWRDNETAAFELWKNTETTEYEEWQTSIRQQVNDLIVELDQWANEEHHSFDEWFSQLQIVLSGDVAGNLQVEIEKLQDREFQNYFSLGDRTTVISDDNMRIETVEPSGRILSSISHDSVDGSLMIVRLVEPAEDYPHLDSMFNFEVTTKFKNNNHLIVSTTKKIPKHVEHPVEPSEPST